MANNKKLYSYVEVDDRTPIQKLKIADQLRVLLKHITHDPANELRTEDAVTTEYMTLKANLSDFLRKATNPIRRGEKREVIVNISNKFDPVFNEVITSHDIADFFDVSIVRPKLEYDIPYDFMLRLRVKDN